LFNKRKPVQRNLNSVLEKNLKQTAELSKGEPGMTPSLHFTRNQNMDQEKTDNELDHSMEDIVSGHQIMTSFRNSNYRGPEEFVTPDAPQADTKCEVVCREWGCKIC
jgi:hypothetical protein